MTELSGWTKKLQSTSQSQTCTKNSHGHCLLVCYLSDPLQLSESWWNYYIWEVCKSRRCTENCNACSWHWSTERTQFFSMITPNHTLYNQCFKSWMNWATKLCFICHIHLASYQLTSQHLQASQQLFAGKMLPQREGCRKCFPGIPWILKNRCLCYRNKQTYFLLAKMCCYNSSYFD